MIDFLDPSAVRIPARHRQRLASDAMVDAMPSALDTPALAAPRQRE